jgi:murein DD-endopeptidase MepM/ murein hydrolase activator NlpD
LSQLRIVAFTVLLTSLFWIAFGLWRLGPPQVAAPLRAVQPTQTATHAVAPALTVRTERPSPTAGPGGLIIPVAGVQPSQLVDTFEQARAEGRRHDAIDIMAARGTPVIAAAPGVVEKLFYSKAGGNTVYERSPDRRLIYYYAHLDSYAPGLAEGAVLRAGDAIGKVGSTGDASPDAPHLHFEIQQTSPDRKWYQQTTPLDPYPLLTGR